jgi:hypothetical protein
MQLWKFILPFVIAGKDGYDVLQIASLKSVLKLSTKALLRQLPGLRAVTSRFLSLEARFNSRIIHVGFVKTTALRQVLFLRVLWPSSASQHSTDSLLIYRHQYHQHYRLLQCVCSFGSECEDFCLLRCDAI